MYYELMHNLLAVHQSLILILDSVELSENAGDYLVEIALVRRLAQKDGHSRVQAPRSLLLCIVCGQSNDDRNSFIFALHLQGLFVECESFPGRIYAIHDWHVDVHEDGFVRAAVELSFDLLDGFTPV